MTPIPSTKLCGSCGQVRTLLRVREILQAAPSEDVLEVAERRMRERGDPPRRSWLTQHACLDGAPAQGPLDDYAREAPCGGVFTCATCGSVVGWCRGAGDEYPDDCDDCANAKHEAKERVA